MVPMVGDALAESGFLVRFEALSQRSALEKRDRSVGLRTSTVAHALPEFGQHRLRPRFPAVVVVVEVIPEAQAWSQQALQQERLSDRTQRVVEEEQVEVWKARAGAARCRS